MAVTLWKQPHLTWYCSILFGNAKLWLIKPSIDNTIVYPFRYTAVQYKTLAFFIANANQCPATSYDLLYHTSHLHYVCPEEVKASIKMLFSYVAMLDQAIHGVWLHFNLATSQCQEYFADFAGNMISAMRAHLFKPPKQLIQTSCCDDRVIATAPW